MNESNSTTKVETIEYKGWKNCVRLDNGQVELIVTTDVGPRIISAKHNGCENIFKEYSATLGSVGGDKWNIFGGHRLWHAPENDPRTYCPDNSPVQWEQIPGGAKFTQDVETTTGIGKEIEVRLSEKGPRAQVLHRLTNTNLWMVKLAPWALSVMNVGGTAIVPLPPRGTHPENLLPTSSLTIWPFTDMSDARWTWGEKYVLLRQDENAESPQKIGVHNSSGWAAYVNGDTLFVKTFKYSVGARYPDFGSTVELFTNSEMLELETLGPTTRLQPETSVEHVEVWNLLEGVAAPKSSEEAQRDVLPLAEAEILTPFK